MSLEFSSKLTIKFERFSSKLVINFSKVLNIRTNSISYETYKSAQKDLEEALTFCNQSFDLYVDTLIRQLFVLPLCL